MIPRTCPFAILIVFLTSTVSLAQMDRNLSGKDNTRDSVMYVLEMDALTMDDVLVSFNVVYVVSYDTGVLKKLAKKDKKALSDGLIAPLVRSNIRYTVSKMKGSEVVHFPTEAHVADIKKELKEHELELIRFVATRRED